MISFVIFFFHENCRCKTKITNPSETSAISSKLLDKNNILRQRRRDRTYDRIKKRNV